MADLGEEDRAWLAQLYTGVAHPYRIALLDDLAAGESVPSVAERVGTTRGTLQNHLERLIDSDLVYRPEDGATYAVTPLGEYMLDQAEADADELGCIIELVEAAEEEAAEELAPAEDILGEDEWERKLHTRKWEKAIERFDELLGDEQ